MDHNTMSQDGACASKEPKHMEMVYAVNQMDEVISNLEDLLRTIQGPKPETVSAVKNPQPMECPSLADTLNHYPNYLREKRSNIEDLVSRIRGEIL